MENLFYEQLTRQSEILDSEKLKAKLQELIEWLNKRSNELAFDSVKALKVCDYHNTGLKLGYSNAYSLCAEWLNKIIEESENE